jgi:hypothetical protein
MLCGFFAGFAAAWILRSIALAKAGRLQKSTRGFLESERLMKETLQKENALVHQTKQTIQLNAEKKLQEAAATLKIMDENILLLQKSNEETEALLKAGLPEVHNLKVKLIEANNIIARYKAQQEKKGGNS